MGKCEHCALFSKCGDRKPGERVLVLDAFLPSFNIMRVDYRNSERQKTFACSHCVTHWMPLPNPPQKDGDGE